ncbi:hypothetical protein NX722_15915 [Endozoicomonas gorgoniicola]|uniref:Uncharacterized protein n=1 Tax=Endozoicomonas gorgoniicola TaxID=1234144 RepID=A0ABT3MXG0_9GAMM|nr:hypothetical protein [Endozoicomonas gorgoniicola]MCW7554076.1 hypothetical protein [Endozoicomonas gorgoniicola]
MPVNFEQLRTASTLRKQRRIYHAERSGELVRYLRQNYDIKRLLHALHSFNSMDRVGNCFEYSIVAINHGVETHIPNIWLASQNLHQFLVLADTASLNDLAVDEFWQHEDNDFWVCDPWFNIYCKMHLYRLMTVIKSTQWEHEGKEIYIDDNNTEPASMWVNRLILRKMQFVKMTDSEGQPTNNWSRLSSTA